jgi:hypothetical protein
MGQVVRLQSAAPLLDESAKLLANAQRIETRLPLSELDARRLDRIEARMREIRDELREIYTVVFQPPPQEHWWHRAVRRMLRR